MNHSHFAWLHNGECVEIDAIPRLDGEQFSVAVSTALSEGCRILSLFAAELPGTLQPFLFAVLGKGVTGDILVTSAAPCGSYPAITPLRPEADRFEREIYEQYGIIPKGHPGLNPVRGERSWADGEAAGRPFTFTPTAGDEIHEVAVGPVHAGVIEPGHFRFHCHGERILALDIALGYQHRGIEQALIGGPDKRTLPYLETLSGDTTAGHTLAFCQALESLSCARVSLRAQVLRGIALELERLANHTGDLGALAGDAGYQPTAAACGRLRGEFLNMSAVLCGNRFSRNLICPGGLTMDVDERLVADLLERLERTFADVTMAVELLWKTPSVLARFEETGRVSPETCRELGLVGPAARACGVVRDARYDFPAGCYTVSQVPVSTWKSGDVYARAQVRWLEIQGSVRFIRDHLSCLPAGNVCSPAGEPAASHLVVTVVEGWRGEICHAALTGPDGRFIRYKVVDPSFHNWPGLSRAVRGEAIMDFPLCNKSFNLSYCGHDL